MKFCTKSTLKWVKASIFFTLTDSRLNHLLMILIYNEELDKINVKILTNKLIKEKEFRIATLGLYQFWAFACFSLFVVTASPVTSLGFLSISPWDHQKILRFFYDFREYCKKTMERNGLMLPCGVPQEVYPKSNAGFWTLFSSCTHIYGFGLPSRATNGAYIMFFVNQPLHHHLTHNACNTFL